MFKTKSLKHEYDYLAPDNSEIRLLLRMKGGNMWHCKLPQGETSKAIFHRSVDEMWFFISGNGLVWRSEKNFQKTVEVKQGTCITIPARTKFQFRNAGTNDLEFIGVTMPPWPGSQEAQETVGKW
jgi:mannose-6-phosphate isomerase-like protein (cupin superfamily)